MEVKKEAWNHRLFNSVEKLCSCVYTTWNISLCNKPCTINAAPSFLLHYAKSLGFWWVLSETKTVYIYRSRRVRTKAIRNSTTLHHLTIYPHQQLVQTTPSTIANKPQACVFHQHAEVPCEKRNDSSSHKTPTSKHYPRFWT